MSWTDNLPTGDSSTLSLVHPTEEEQLIQSKLNGTEWRGALSPSAYLRREATLSQQALTKEGGITYWILIDTALKNNPLEPDSGTRLPLASSNLPTARPLYAGELPELCKIDEELIKESLKSRAKSSKTAVALIPDIETAQWHHAREEFVGQEVHGRVPKIKGAIVGDEVGKRVWCYWTRVWYNEDPAVIKGNTMHILRLVVEEDVLGSNKASEGEGHAAAIAALLALAQREAEEWKTEHVEVWSPSASVLAGARVLDKSAEVIERDSESIASLLWYPEHEGSAIDSIDWTSNEKYAWC
ncbi:hypothetical protein N0V94_000240 [Neodidymelliopsis sp. IMI 364377]|nr:hypothetical protein N0V94_000240 [Neodidymelliopsis sp. IMI 364377]